MEPNANVGTNASATPFYQTGTVHIQSVAWLPDKNALQLTVENETEWNMAKRFLFDLDWSLTASYGYGDAPQPCLFDIWETSSRDILYVKNKKSGQAGIQQCLRLLFDSNLITRDRYMALITEINQSERASLAIG